MVCTDSTLAMDVFRWMVFWLGWAQVVRCTFVIFNWFIRSFTFNCARNAKKNFQHCMEKKGWRKRMIAKRKREREWEREKRGDDSSNEQSTYGMEWIDRKNIKINKRQNNKTREKLELFILQEILYMNLSAKFQEKFFISIGGIPHAMPICCIFKWTQVKPYDQGVNLNPIKFQSTFSF